MSSPQNFRGALNGFNREDVVNYISYISNRHETQLNALRTEADELRRELADREQSVQEQERLRSELEQQQEVQNTLRAELEESRMELELYREESGRKDAQIEALKQELEKARSAAAEPRRAEPSRWSEELNAYRRAESAERRARERVNQMYDQANGALAEASVRVERAAAGVAELAAKVEADLALLRQAIGDSENILADTAVVLGAIRPETD